MFRRDLKLFFKCLIGGGVLLIILAAVCFGAAAAVMSASEPSDELICVAVVDNEDSVMSRILINTIMNTDYLSTLLTAEKTDRESAERGLESGKYAAVFILPEGFLSDIYRGRESHGTAYLSSALSAQAGIIESAIRFGEHLLLSGQSAVFAGERLLSAHGISGDEYSYYTTHLNARLLAEAFAANERYFVTEAIDYAGTGMTSEGHYALCWTVFLLFMASLFFIPLFCKDCTKAVLARLRSLGVSGVRFMWTKLLFMFILRFVLIMAAGIILTRLEVGIVLNIPVFIISAILCSAFVSILGACLSMCFSDAISANVITALGGIFLCGGLVPLQLLPDALTHIGALTPYGAAKSLMAPIFGVAFEPADALCAVIYTVAALLLISWKLKATLTGGAAND